MRTVFIVNPEAGQRTEFQKLLDSIAELLTENMDIEIYITKAVDDARNYVKNYCQERGAARFIACGGDGTLNEVLNGVIGVDAAEVGVIPIGTGNDFCRNFGESCGFHNVLSQLNGESVSCDAIKYRTIIDGVEKTGYCANMFNIGFDCNVADMTADMKKRPFISGSMAYFISIFVTLIKKKGANLKIELDGKLKHCGRLLLTSIANGCYCGGGIKSNPLAELNDGLINVNIINNVSRLRFITLLPYYMKGTFLKLKGIEKIISSVKCRKIKITPLGGMIRICNDGEICDAGEIEFEIEHNAFNFVVPDGNINKKNIREKEFIAN